MKTHLHTLWLMPELKMVRSVQLVIHVITLMSWPIDSSHYILQGVLFTSETLNAHSMVPIFNCFYITATIYRNRVLTESRVI